MNHVDALNLILANACPSEVLDDDIKVFILELHCGEAEVRARLISTMNTIQYEVLSVMVR